MKKRARRLAKELLPVEIIPLKLRPYSITEQYKYGLIGLAETTIRIVNRRIRRMPRKELCDIAGEIQGETEKAYRFFDGKVAVWLPKSQCEWDPDEKIMTIPEWLGKEKELI